MQERIVQVVALVLVSVLGVPFLVWLAREASAFFAAYWPHAKLALWLFAICGIAALVLGDLTSLGLVIDPPRPLVYPGSTWITRMGTIGLQFALIAWIASFAWIKLLRILYPIGNARRPISFTDLISGVLSIAIPVGLSAAWVAQFAGSLLVTLAIGISAFFLAFALAWLILRRMAPQRAADR